MNKAFLCIGGNLGDRQKLIKSCCVLLEKSCGKITAHSKIYETEAWGSDSKNKFLNQVLILQTEFNHGELMKKLLSIEKKLGRKRTSAKNSDRLMDIDILFFNKSIIKTKLVQIPHPRLHLRNFVLKPLMDVDKNFVHPVFKQKIKDIYKKSKDKLKVTEYKTAKYICIEGNIGSGKTTLAKELAANLKAGMLPEKFEKNDLLPLFYKFPQTFAFPLEYSFLLARYQQITDAFKQPEKIIVSDYSIYKCYWFAKINLGKKDFKFFSKHFRVIENRLPKPDLIVHLDTSVKNLQKNIKIRGRAYEMALSPKYLQNIGKEYEKGLKTLNNVPVLRFKIAQYKPGIYKELIKTIKKAIG